MLTSATTKEEIQHETLLDSPLNLAGSWQSPKIIFEPGQKLAAPKKPFRSSPEVSYLQ